MILPKKLFDKIEYFEHSSLLQGEDLYDVFTIHFKSWFRRCRVIKIRRQLTGADADGNLLWAISASAADLYNQLNGWAIQTWDEKLDSIKSKYEPPKDGSNVIKLKPKPKDINDE